MPESKHIPAAIHARKQTHTCSNPCQTANTYLQQHATESKDIPAAIHDRKQRLETYLKFFLRGRSLFLGLVPLARQLLALLLAFPVRRAAVYRSVKRGLHVFQKRPACLPKEACVSSKRGLRVFQNRPLTEQTRPNDTLGYLRSDLH